MLNKNFWTLNKALVLGLLGGFAFLLLDIRYEHRSVLLDERTAWIPIIYSGLTLVIGGILLSRWERGGRLILSLLFAGSMIVGGLGVWFHTKGHPQRAVVLVGQSIQLVLSPATPDEDKATKAGGAPQKARKKHGPPLLAPLAFCGLGLFGLLACSRRLKAETETDNETIPLAPVIPAPTTRAEFPRVSPN